LADADYGEMFHNFFMDERIRKHAGVDLSKLQHRMKTITPERSEVVSTVYGNEIEPL
jgi:hypothetical protein